MTELKERNYCFTVFNREWKCPDHDRIKYCIWQLEKCPDTGREHMQGYIELTSPQRIKATQTIMNAPNCHLEKRRGNRQQAIDYCKKDRSKIDGPWEYGVNAGQGTRTDLSELKELALTKPIEECIDHISNFQQLRFVEGLQKYKKPYNGPRDVYYYYGPSGSGKSKKASEEAGDYNEISYHNGFWVGYRGSRNVIINDLRANVPLNEILRITDRYPIYLNIKGSEVPWLAEKIWITTDRSPDELYRAEAENGQLKRRCSEIIFLGRDGTKSGGNTSPPPISPPSVARLLTETDPKSYGYY